jgi:hypothetical protein
MLMALKDVILANHTYNEGQIGWYVAGSALNLLLQHKLFCDLYKSVLCKQRTFMFFSFVKIHIKCGYYDAIFS